jgi:hypothetical protein
MAMLGCDCASGCITALLPRHRHAIATVVAPVSAPALSARQRDRDVTGVLSNRLWCQA